MEKDIRELEPKILWSHFYDLTQIPRPSKKESKVVQFVVDFATSHGLEWLKDEVENVIVRKPASQGMENRKGIVLQAHLDMVPQKNSDKKHNFETDAIETLIADGWVKANKTTLGADNGIGAAAMLGVLASKNLKHGPIEALFTIDEETGMTGAFHLKPGVLKGDILINTDSEDEGELYVGCAGGSNASCKFSFDQQAVPANWLAYKISLIGLQGGHSGLDIILGRGNANKLMFRLLKHLAVNAGVRLASIDGGSLRNAIPREAFATITLPPEKLQIFEKALSDFENIYKSEYKLCEPDLKLSATKCDCPPFLIDELTQTHLINAIQACPNGVVRMSDSMVGLVETSTNLAIVKSDHQTVQVLSLLRSSVDSAKSDVESTIESVFKLAGAQVSFNGQYPGWKPNMDSEILATMKDVYRAKFGKVPEVKAIHAGLECGILAGAYPHWDMVSFGPTIRHPHSPDEKVNIDTVHRFWDFLLATLENAPLK